MSTILLDGTIQANGPFPIIALANASDVSLTTTSITTVLSFTPIVQGNYFIYCYYRVVTASTLITLTLTYTDGSGSQTIKVVPGIYQGVASYTVQPIYINSAASAITLSATAGTANQVSVSCSICPT